MMRRNWSLKPVGRFGSSVARVLSSVRGWHRFLLDEAIVDDDVAHDVTAPKQVSRLPKAPTVDQVAALLDAAGIEQRAGVLEHRGGQAELDGGAVRAGRKRVAQRREGRLGTYPAWMRPGDQKLRGGDRPDPGTCEQGRADPHDQLFDLRLVFGSFSLQR